MDIFHIIKIEKPNRHTIPNSTFEIITPENYREWITLSAI
jgi:hypothetical protein